MIEYRVYFNGPDDDDWGDIWDNDTVGIEED